MQGNDDGAGSGCSPCPCWNGPLCSDHWILGAPGVDSALRPDCDRDVHTPVLLGKDAVPFLALALPLLQVLLLVVRL